MDARWVVRKLVNRLNFCRFTCSLQKFMLVLRGTCLASLLIVRVTEEREKTLTSKNPAEGSARETAKARTSKVNEELGS
jgi:hypothetical protein